MHKISYIFVLAFLGLACDSRLEGELAPDYIGDQLTINGFLSPDSVWLKVGKTVNPYEDYKSRDFIAPQLRVFVLDQQGGETELLSKDGLNFKSASLRLAPGALYRVKAIAPGLADAISEPILIPDTALLHNPRIEKDAADPQRGLLYFSFYDRPGKDHYLATFSLKKGNWIGGGGHIWLHNEDLNGKCYRYGIFPDDCFGPARNTLVFGYNTQYLKPIPDTLIIRFGKVSESVYKAQESNPPDDGFIQGINEPPATYSNIKGGIGMVFGQYWKEYAVRLE